MIIEPATLEDVPHLVKFQQEMAYETEGLQLASDNLRKGIETLLSQPEKGKYFVARINDKLAGCLMITSEWSEWRNASILWIQSVYVDKSFRRQGIYKALYNHIKKMVEDDNKYEGIRLYVDKSNVKAQEVYKSLGMNDQHYLLFEWINE